jgi:hypothetical protein
MSAGRGRALADCQAVTRRQVKRDSAHQPSREVQPMFRPPLRQGIWPARTGTTRRQSRSRRTGDPLTGLKREERPLGSGRLASFPGRALSCEPSSSISYDVYYVNYEGDVPHSIRFGRSCKRILVHFSSNVCTCFWIRIRASTALVADLWIKEMPFKGSQNCKNLRFELGRDVRRMRCRDQQG